MIDNRKELFPKEDQEQIAHICHRKFGIGADGLILIENCSEANFKMVYFNADGAPGSFCGNGSRAATQYASTLGLINKSGNLLAFDGLHDALILDGVIKMQMADVQNGSNLLDGTFIDTGSPHYIEFRENLDSLDVFTEGKNLREHDQFKPGGSNINFANVIETNVIKVRTFERGVEDETLSCGTGVTASAMASTKELGRHSILVHTLGGELEVEFEKSAEGFKEVFLTGPAKKVYSGKIDL